VYDVFDSESALELNPELVTLTPGTFCITPLNILALMQYKSVDYL